MTEPNTGRFATTNLGVGDDSLIESTFAPNSKVLIKEHQVDFETLTGFEAENKYSISFENGYKAVALEESTFMHRWCLGSSRPFKLHIVFKDNKVAFMRLERPYRWIFDEIFVWDPIKEECIGNIRFKISIVSREFKVFNQSGVMLFLLTSTRCQSFTFYIHNAVGTRVGEIKKQSRRHGSHLDADIGITFPHNSSPSQKALLVGAAFLIDYIYFEDRPDEDKPSYLS